MWDAATVKGFLGGQADTDGLGDLALGGLAQLLGDVDVREARETWGWTLARTVSVSGR